MASSFCPSYAPYTRAQSNVVPKYWAERYERDAAKNWDLFYMRNRDRFFKDRHYLQTEWSELRPADNHDGCSQLDDCGSGHEDVLAELQSSLPLVMLEAGCGVGNTIFPLLRSHPALQVFAMDFSATAVGIVKSHPLYASGRVVASVGDLTSGSLPAELASCRAQVATLVFVLSAICPEKMPSALAAVSAGLAQGGMVLFRDYASGDGAQVRLQQAAGAKQLDDTAPFFVRQDGTRAYYFTTEELTALFDAAGFDALRCEYSLRRTTNHQKGLVLERRFITAKFRKRAPQTEGARPADHLSSGQGAVSKPAAPGLAPTPAPTASAGAPSACPQPPPSPRRESPGPPKSKVQAAAATAAPHKEDAAEPAVDWNTARKEVCSSMRRALGPHATPQNMRKLLAQIADME